MCYCIIFTTLHLKLPKKNFQVGGSADNREFKQFYSLRCKEQKVNVMQITWPACIVAKSAQSIDMYYLAHILRPSNMHMVLHLFPSLCMFFQHLFDHRQTNRHCNLQMLSLTLPDQGLKTPTILNNKYWRLTITTVKYLHLQNNNDDDNNINNDHKNDSDCRNIIIKNNQSSVIHIM